MPRLPRATLRALTQRSDAQGLAQLGLHAALLAATGTLVVLARGSGWLIPALLLHGVVLSFLFCALHECIHGTAFARGWLNRGCALLCGALLVLPPEYFRQFHFAHHRHTQDPARDPELAAPKVVTRRDYLWRVSGIPYWADRLGVTLRHALTGRAREGFIAPARAAAVVREARLLWGTYLALAAVALALRGGEMLLLLWLVPALLGQPFLRLFLLAEHTGCALTDDMLRNTRTTLTTGAVRLLTWRMSWHAEHHAFPSVPFHALGKLHALIGARERVIAPGYLAFHRELLGRLRAAGPRPSGG